MGSASRSGDSFDDSPNPGTGWLRRREQGSNKGIDPEKVADDEDGDERDEESEKSPANLGAPAHGSRLVGIHRVEVSVQRLEDGWHGRAHIHGDLDRDVAHVGSVT